LDYDRFRINMEFNQTLYNDPNLCTLQTCPLTWAAIDYIPNLGGNAFYLAIFAASLVVQIAFGVFYHTWAFLGAMVGGEVLEIIGYAARVELHSNPFIFNNFLMWVFTSLLSLPTLAMLAVLIKSPVYSYLICLTIAPCFFSAGIYLCFSRIVVTYGERHARFKPKTYTTIFICSDILSLVLQSVGGALADTAGSRAASQTGINIMIAGLSCQVVSLAIFFGLCADFAVQVRKEGATSHGTLVRFGISTRVFHAFLYGQSHNPPSSNESKCRVGH